MNYSMKTGLLYSPENVPQYVARCGNMPPETILKKGMGVVHFVHLALLHEMVPLVSSLSQTLTEALLAVEWCSGTLSPKMVQLRIAMENIYINIPVNGRLKQSIPISYQHLCL